MSSSTCDEIFERCYPSATPDSAALVASGNRQALDLCQLLRVDVDRRKTDDSTIGFGDEAVSSQIAQFFLGAWEQFAFPHMGLDQADHRRYIFSLRRADGYLAGVGCH